LSCSSGYEIKKRIETTKPVGGGGDRKHRKKTGGVTNSKTWLDLRRENSRRRANYTCRCDYDVLSHYLCQDSKCCWQFARKMGLGQTKGGGRGGRRKWGLQWKESNPLYSERGRGLQSRDEKKKGKAGETVLLKKMHSTTQRKEGGK